MVIPAGTIARATLEPLTHPLSGRPATTSWYVSGSVSLPRSSRRSHRSPRRWSIETYVVHALMSLFLPSLLLLFFLSFFLFCQCVRIYGVSYSMTDSILDNCSNVLKGQERKALSLCSVVHYSLSTTDDYCGCTKYFHWSVLDLLGCTKYSRWSILIILSNTQCFRGADTACTK